MVILLFKMFLLITIEYALDGDIVLRKLSNPNFHINICPVSLTSHLLMHAQLDAYNNV